MLCVPVWKEDRIHYLSVPLGYRMWQKKKSKLELAVSMIRHIMPVFHTKKNVIILCGSGYVKKGLVSIVDEYENLDLTGNVGSDSIMYDLPQQRTGKRGRPALRGKNCPSRMILRCLMKKTVVTMWLRAASLQTFLEKGQSLHMLHLRIRRMASDACFSVPFFQNRSRYFVHGRKNCR